MKSAIENIKPNGKAKAQEVAVVAAAVRKGPKPQMVGDQTLVAARAERKAAHIATKRELTAACRHVSDADKGVARAEKTVARAEATLAKVFAKPLKNKVEQVAAVAAARTTIKDAKSVLGEARATQKAAIRVANEASKVEQKAAAFRAKLDN